MKANSLIWSKGIAGWVATFFLLTALSQTCLIIIVMKFGERKEVAQHITGLNAYYSRWPFSQWTLEVNYLYEINGTRYTAQVDIKPKTIDLPFGAETSGPPLEEWPDHFDVIVWDQLPQFPIPLVSGYNPASQTTSVWLMAAFTTTIYICLHRLSRREEAHSCSLLR